MALTDIKIKTAKPKDKPYKLADGEGMYLLVSTNGSKYWRMKYRIAGKEKILSIGIYPDISLADARAKRMEARKTLASGGDPSEAKKEEKLALQISLENTFEAIAREWHSSKSDRWSLRYRDEIIDTFEKDIFPYIGKRPIADIKPMEVLNSCAYLIVLHFCQTMPPSRKWTGGFHKMANLFQQLPH